ncbi:MAG: hypothetical protein WCK96_19320 [Methylococcales bacterium]
MTTEDMIIDLFCRIDDQMKNVPNHRQAALLPSELVTIGMLYAIKGVGQRAFYRWLSRDYGDWFPDLPERTRLFRRMKTQWQWAQLFLAKPSLLGIIDSYGVELIHPIRKGRNPDAWVESGISNHRWIVGGKLCLAVNHLGQIIGWAWAAANAHDSWFHPLIEKFKDQCVMLADTGFHAKEGDPDTMKLCRRGEWNSRMLIETVYSMLTVVCHTKKMRHQVDDYFQAHLGFMVAAFNTLIEWFGLLPDENGFVPLSIAEFNL